MTNRERFSRLGTVAASVGVAVGLVILFCHGVREFVGATVRPSGVAETKAAEPDVRIVPRTVALADLVPKALRENYAGLAFNTESASVSMPMDLAERVYRDRAESAGWKTLDQPYASPLALELVGQYHYELPDGDFLIRAFVPIDEANTRITEIRIPRPNLSGDSPNLTFTEVMTAHSAEIRAKLPRLLAEVAVGDIVHTQLIRRGAGASFYLSSVERVSPEMHASLIAAALLRAGWRFQPELNQAYVKDNLSVRYHTESGEGGVGSTAVFRFSDDEVVTVHEREDGAA